MLGILASIDELKSIKTNNKKQKEAIEVAIAVMRASYRFLVNEPKKEMSLCD